MIIIACKKENNQKTSVPFKNELKSIKKEPEPEPEPKIKSISYKSKTNSKILDIIFDYEYINSLKWERNQIFEIKGKENEIIKVYLLNGQLLKMEVFMDKKIQSELYLADNNLRLFIERNEIEKEAISVSENHFYFDNNKLLKKVINEDYDIKISKKELLKEEERVKNNFVKYVDQVLNEIINSRE